MTKNHEKNGLFVLGGPETQLHDILWAVHDEKNHGRSEGRKILGSSRLRWEVGGRVMRVHVREKRASLGPRPPTVIGNSPKFSSPSLLPLFFPSWTAQRMSCSCVSGPPRMKSPFSVMIFCHKIGAHHIYHDTVFCHNYCHRSVISMTEKFRSAQNVTDVSFFCSVIRLLCIPA